MARKDRAIVEVVRPVVGHTLGDRLDVDTSASPWANMLDSGLIEVVEGAKSLDDDEHGTDSGNADNGAGDDGGGGQ